MAQCTGLYYYDNVKNYVSIPLKNISIAAYILNPFVETFVACSYETFTDISPIFCLKKPQKGKVVKLLMHASTGWTYVCDINNTKNYDYDSECKIIKVLSERNDMYIIDAPRLSAGTLLNIEYSYVETLKLKHKNIASNDWICECDYVLQNPTDNFNVMHDIDIVIKSQNEILGVKSSEKNLTIRKYSNYWYEAIPCFDKFTSLSVTIQSTSAFSIYKTDLTHQIFYGIVATMKEQARSFDMPVEFVFVLIISNENVNMVRDGLKIALRSLPQNSFFNICSCDKYLWARSIKYSVNAIEMALQYIDNFVNDGYNISPILQDILKEKLFDEKNIIVISEKNIDDYNIVITLLKQKIEFGKKNTSRVFCVCTENDYDIFKSLADYGNGSCVTFRNDNFDCALMSIVKKALYNYCYASSFNGFKIFHSKNIYANDYQLLYFAMPHASEKSSLESHKQSNYLDMDSVFINDDIVLEFHTYNSIGNVFTGCSDDLLTFSCLDDLYKFNEKEEEYVHALPKSLENITIPFNINNKIITNKITLLFNNFVNIFSPKNQMSLQTKNVITILEPQNVLDYQKIDGGYNITTDLCELLAKHYNMTILEMHEQRKIINIQWDEYIYRVLLDYFQINNNMNKYDVIIDKLKIYIEKIDKSIMQ